MTKKVIMYMRDDSIIYKYYKEHKIKFKSLNNNKINDEVLFKKELLTIIKKENINSNLFGDILYFICNNESILELNKIKEIFREIGFQKVYVYNIKEIIEKDKTYIFEDNYNITLFYKEKSYSIHRLSNKIVYDYIIELINQDLIDIPIYYIYNDNNEMVDYLNKNKLKVLYIYSPNDYIINKLEKKVTNM